jgi:hypothetical protein
MLMAMTPLRIVRKGREKILQPALQVNVKAIK